MRSAVTRRVMFDTGLLLFSFIIYLGEIYGGGVFDILDEYRSARLCRELGFLGEKKDL